MFGLLRKSPWHFGSTLSRAKGAVGSEKYCARNNPPDCFMFLNAQQSTHDDRKQRTSLPGAATEEIERVRRSANITVLLAHQIPPTTRTRRHHELYSESHTSTCAVLCDCCDPWMHNAKGRSRRACRAGEAFFSRRRPRAGPHVRVPSEESAT